MSFVHHEQAQSAAAQQGLQRGGQQHFRCNVQNGLFALMDGVQALFPLLMGHIGVEEGGAVHPAGFQLADLILHQGDQRSDNEGHCLMHLCQIDARHLIECGLARTGGSGQEHIGVILIAIQCQLALLDNGADDLALADLHSLGSCRRVFVEVQHTEIGACAPVLLEDSPIPIYGFRFHLLLVLGAVQCKGRAALCCHKRQHIVGIVFGVLFPLHRQHQRTFHLAAEELVCQYQRRNFVGQRCRCVRKNGLLFLIERNTADIFALMPIEQCHIITLIQCADGCIVMAENFRRTKLGLFALVRFVQRFGVLCRDAAGHIGREGVVVDDDELCIKHGTGFLHGLKNCQHLLIDTDRHAVLHHEALHQFPLRRINFGNADAAILVQNLACRQNRIFAMCQPADIGRYKTTKKENHIFACIAGNEFFGVLLKILLCVHGRSSCTFYTSSNVLSP